MLPVISYIAHVHACSILHDSIPVYENTVFLLVGTGYSSVLLLSNLEIPIRADTVKTCKTVVGNADSDENVKALRYIFSNE